MVPLDKKRHRRNWTAASVMARLLDRHTSDKRVAPRRFGRMENSHRAGSGGDHRAVDKTDPLTLILAEQFIAHGPILRLVLAPVGMDLAGDFRGKLVHNVF